MAWAQDQSMSCLKVHFIYHFQRGKQASETGNIQLNKNYQICVMIFKLDIPKIMSYTVFKPNPTQFSNADAATIQPQNKRTNVSLP